MKKKTLIRLVVLFAVMTILAFLATYTPLNQYLTYEYLSEAIRGAGALGFIIFVAAFIFGTLMNLPGFLFIILAYLVYGYGLGFAAAYTGAVLAVIVHFLFVRTLGGEALTEIKQPLVKKIMANFDTKPLRTVIILRVLFFISPPINYVLALSNVKLHHFIIGTMIGGILPLLTQAAFLYFAKDLVMQKLNGM